MNYFFIARHCVVAAKTQKKKQVGGELARYVNKTHI